MQPTSEIKNALDPLFQPIIGQIRIKTYFSYYGLFKNEKMFALYKDNSLYLRSPLKYQSDIQAIPNTFVLVDHNAGIQTKNFYFIPSHYFQSTDFPIWIKSIIEEAQATQSALEDKQKHLIRSLSNMNVSIERTLKRIHIHSIDDLFKIGGINAFIKLHQYGIEGSEQLLFKLYGATHNQNMYTFSDKLKKDILTEANQAFYDAGLRKRFIIR